MLAIGKGAEQEILEQMKLLGSNNIIVTPLVEQKEGKARGRRQEGVEEVLAGPHVPRRRRRSERRFPTSSATSGEVVVNSVDHARGPAPLGQGRRRRHDLLRPDEPRGSPRAAAFAAAAVRDGAPVAIIGHGVKTRFFTTEDPIGQPIKVGNAVAHRRRRARGPEGVRARPRSGSASATPNMDVYVPLPTMLLRYRNRAQVTQRDIEQSRRASSTTTRRDSTETRGAARRDARTTTSSTG